LEPILIVDVVLWIRQPPFQLLRNNLLKSLLDPLQQSPRPRNPPWEPPRLRFLHRRLIHLHEGDQFRSILVRKLGPHENMHEEEDHEGRDVAEERDRFPGLGPFPEVFPGNGFAVFFPVLQTLEVSEGISQDRHCP
jgi:hypothetical protein